MVYSSKKRLGQHFLHDNNIIRKIINVIAPQKNDNLVEVGPGTGALTTNLLPLVNSLDVVELDREIIPILEHNCKMSPKLIIHIADILKINFQKFTTPIRFIGNIPYNISTPLLFNIIKHIHFVKDMHFMLQKEVAERICSFPGTKTYGRLSVMLQYYFDLKILFCVGSRSFYPAPKVESAFIRLIPWKTREISVNCEELFSCIVREAFCQRRKIIANSLKKHVTLPGALKALSIDFKLRPEQLTVKQFVLLCNEIKYKI